MYSSEPKQVIVMRKDLKMRKGKIAAQSAHASMAVILNMIDWHKGEGNIILSQDSPIYKWLHKSFPKICVYVDSEEELLELYKKAKANQIPCVLITDAGRTEFKGVPTNTCIAIGPDFPEIIDPITGHLPLY